MAARKCYRVQPAGVELADDCCAKANGCSECIGGIFTLLDDLWNSIKLDCRSDWQPEIVEIECPDRCPAPFEPRASAGVEGDANGLGEQTADATGQESTARIARRRQFQSWDELRELAGRIRWGTPTLADRERLGWTLPESVEGWLSETMDCMACRRKHTRAAGCSQAVLDAIDRTMATDRDPPPIEQGRSFHDRLVDAELLRGLCVDEDDEPATLPYRHCTPERPPGRSRARGKVEPDSPSVGALSKSCRLRAFMTFGTRPEAIKMAPIIDECRRRSEQIETVVCLTGQHLELLAQVTRYFGIQADANFALMRPGQSPAEFTARCLDQLDRELARLRPDCVVVQGDTSTVMAAALAAFLHRIPLVHLEAGLRTGNMLAPWPEEMNRRVASLAATLHCAPTDRAAANLKAEGIPGCKIHVTGNTVIDALLATRERERANAGQWQQQYAMLGDRRLVLVTGHRRESFCGGHERVCRAVAILARRFSDSVFLYPVHLNPTVQAAVRPRLSGLANVHLVEPASYPGFVWLMDRAHLILTDSGGVQEEAPSLGKPVLVTRETTERPEAVEAGAAELVGTDVERIVSRATLLLTDREAYEARRIDSNPYGDGQAARRIVDLMLGQGWGMDDGRDAATSLSRLAKTSGTRPRTVR